MSVIFCSKGILFFDLSAATYRADPCNIWLVDRMKFAILSKLRWGWGPFSLFHSFLSPSLWEETQHD